MVVLDAMASNALRSSRETTIPEGASAVLAAAAVDDVFEFSHGRSLRTIAPCARGGSRWRPNHDAHSSIRRRRGAETAACGWDSDVER